MAIDTDQILKMNEFLTNQQGNWRSYWEDLADFCLPRKAWINSIRTKGERVQFNFLYDSTAIRSLRIMAAGFHSNLTNPASRWFALETRNKRLMAGQDVKQWFREVEDMMLAVFNSSNFYNVIQEFYLNYGCFGTGSFMMLRDVEEIVRFTEIPINHANVEEDSNGRVTAFYRNFQLTASQAFGLWGNAAGENVKKDLEKKPFEMHDFLHYTGPRARREAGKEDALNMPIASVWLNKKEKKMITEAGFMEMPYITGRFYKDTNDVFGFSPSMDVLPDIRLVNAMQRTVIRAGMKQADPPLVAPSKGFVLPLNFNPAAMNYRDAKTNKDDIQPLPVQSGNLGISLEMVQEVQKKIEEGFFVPLFRSLAEITKQMTIPEVQRRVAENMVLLGPVVGRTTYEVLDPTIIRLFNIMFRDRLLPDPPEILQDQEFVPVYLSPLAKAQKEADIGAIESFLADVGAIAQSKPEALDMIDEDKTVEIIARMKGTNPEILRSEEEVAAIRKQRAEQQATAAALEMAQGAAQAQRDSAQAEAVKSQVGVQ